MKVHEITICFWTTKTLDKLIMRHSKVCSITGVTFMFSNLLSMESIVTFWLITLTVFMFIEVAEIIVFVKQVTRQNLFQVILSNNIYIGADYLHSVCSLPLLIC